MRQIIRLTESDLHKLVKESVKKILNEGLASPRLKKVARQHGGIRSVNKKYQLDKNNLEYDLIFIKSGESIPWKLEQFVDNVCEFKDGSKYIIIKPEYQKDPKIKEKLESILKQSEDLANSRNVDYPGYTYTDRDYKDIGDGARKYYDVTQTVSPEKQRMQTHRRARGKKTTGLAKGSDISYWEYVRNHLEELAKQTGGRVTDFGDYYVLFDTDENGHMTPESEKIYDEFMKFGLSDANTGWVGDNKLYIEFTDGTYTDSDGYEDYTVDPRGFYKRPKIGTTDFMKQ